MTGGGTVEEAIIPVIHLVTVILGDRGGLVEEEVMVGTINQTGAVRGSL